MEENQNENTTVKTGGKRKIIAITALVVLIAALIGAVVWEGYSIKKVTDAQRRVPPQAQPEAPQGKKPSDYAVGEDYNKAIKSGKPVLTLFYADWCRYCIRFMPVFEQAAKKYGKDIVFAKVNVEDPKYEKLVREHKIAGFPTVIIIDKKYDNKVIIPNSNLSTIEDLGKELEQFIKIRRLLDKK